MMARTGTRPVGFVICAGCLLGIVGSAFAAPPADESEEGRRLLSDVKDHVFSFDDEAFYWFCKYVRRDDALGEYAVGKDEQPTPWKFLLERPSDYRGELVLIEGTLLRKTSFEVPNRPGVGRLHQCELTSRESGAVCTVILTDEPKGVGIRERVRVRAHFIKVRSFRTRQGKEGTGPLLVGRRLVAVGPGGSERVGLGLDIERLGAWLAGATAVLAVAWCVLRRRLRASQVAQEQAHAHVEPPAESDAGYDWLLGDGDDGEPPPAEKR